MTRYNRGAGTCRRIASAAFTLPEVMVASGLGVLVALVIAMFSLYSSRSFAAIANYVDMDELSQSALDRMSRELRQAHHVTGFTASTITFQDSGFNTVQFVYDPGARTLSRVSGGLTNIFLTSCDALQFANYQGTTVSNTFDAYNPAYVTNTRLIQVTWTCSRNILGAKANTESVQSAKIAIRNN
jgi:Tfp pilus assembly protein PilW